MEQLPSDIVDIIYDYKWSAEHYDRWMKVVYEVPQHFWCMKRLRMNNEFMSIFYPGFWTELVCDSFSALPPMIPFHSSSMPEGEEIDEPVGV